MIATGVSFALVSAFVPLLVVAFIGTLNPTSGDVSLFLPVEQSVLAGSVPPADRTALYARYNLIALACGALGSLASAAPPWIARVGGMVLADAMRLAFVTYAGIGAVVAVAYLGLTRKAAKTDGVRRPLEQSRTVVMRLATLFTLDAFGGGFVAQSVLALWLFKRFNLSLAQAASFFFVTTLLAGLSQLVSPRLAARIGLVRTMVYTHVAANLLLMSAALMPTLAGTITCLFLRMTLSSMDVPARQALVMAVVPPEERAAAASVTNVPRSLGAGLSPAIAGWLLAQSTFGWPLLIAGALKITYDVLLLLRFRHPLAEVATHS
jgi:predicted MFS family arabinose efflux permease